MRRGSVLVVLVIVLPVLLCGAALVVGWMSARRGGTGGSDAGGSNPADRSPASQGSPSGPGGTLAERPGPGFAQEATPVQGRPPVASATSVPGRLSDAAFAITYPDGWQLNRFSDKVSAGWEWWLPDRPDSTVRIRRYDNESSSSGIRAAWQGAEGDRRASAEGKFPGYRPGTVDEVPFGGHRTAGFTVAGRPATGEQWVTTGTAGAVVTVTMVVTAPDDPAPYRALAVRFIDGGLQVR